MPKVARRLSSPVFVGRGEQLEGLRSALSRAQAGDAGAVFIGGESGVGKTRLVMEFERLALAAEARFLVGGCVDVGGSELPYAPLLGALRMLVAGVEAGVLAEMIGASGGELGRLLPELGVGPEAATSRASSDAVDPMAQSRLFEGLLGLLGRAGHEAPVVLVIEDLHWADPSTRGFLSFLLRNIRRERLLLVATYRTDELHRRHPLRQFLTEVERLPTVERLDVAPFTRRELGEQLGTILGAAAEPGLVEELFTRSQGNAFFAEELLAASVDGGSSRIPASVRDAVTMRTERVSPATRSVVRCAAVAGSVVGHRLLAAITELGDEALIEALREAIEHGVLVPESTGASYAFRHALLREALYEELLPHERVMLHGSLARALEQDSSLAAGTHGAAAQRATHWSAAHELAPALTASVQAGVEAEGVWAFAEAMSHFEHAAELWQRVPAEQRPAGVSLVELLSRAAEAAHLSGENQRAMTLTRSELDMLDPRESPTAVAFAHARLGRYLLAEEGAALEALAAYRTAAELLPDEPSAVRASILAGEAHILMLRSQFLQAREPCEDAVRIARAVGDSGVECDALNTLGAILAALGAREEAVDLLRRAKQLAEELGALEQLRRAYINLGEALDESAHLEEAAELAREGWERLRERIGTTALFMAAEAAARLMRLGRWQDAGALLRDATEIARQDAVSGLVLAVLAELEALRGDLDAAGEHLESATRLLPSHTELWSRPRAKAAATLALARGDPESVRPLVDPGALTGEHAYAVFLMPLLALAVRAETDLAQRARATGEPAAEHEAVTRAQALLSRVRALAAPDAWPLGPAPVETLREAELCELEYGRAAGEMRAAQWSTLATRWEELGRPFQTAYARVREGEAALAEKLPRERVADALGSARATARRLGAGPLLEEIELLSRRARVRGEEDEAGTEAGDIAGLTEREFDVLRLLAQGRTNPQIGQALYMSPKTASVHVSRILSKLGVETRTEAAGAAYRLGLLDS